MKALPLLVLAAAFVPALVACGSPSKSSAQSSASSAEDVTDAPIANFVKVHDGLYRGGHPDAAGLDYLQNLGVKTIIDLEVGDFIEAFPWDITAEVDGAAQRGITLVREPMSAFEPAVLSGFDQKIDDIIARLQDSNAAPIYVHCKHGQDRTGLVIGLERVLIENWAPKDAHDEMVQHGFHTGFIGLDDYFDRKTGWEDE